MSTYTKLRYPHYRVEPRKDQAIHVLPLLDVKAIQQSFQGPFSVTDVQLRRWLRSDDVLLPLHGLYQAITDTNTFAALQRYLPGMNLDWDEQEALINFVALQNRHSNIWEKADMNHRFRPHADALELCARVVADLASGPNEQYFFAQWKGHQYTHIHRFLACTRVVLTAYADLKRNKNGFFALLLTSPLINDMAYDLRYWWQEYYPFAREETDAGDGSGPSGTGANIPSALKLYVPPPPPVRVTEQLPFRSINYQQQTSSETSRVQEMGPPSLPLRLSQRGAPPRRRQGVQRLVFVHRGPE